MDTVVLDKVKALVHAHHDELAPPQRFGYVDAKGVLIPNTKTSQGCYGGCLSTPAYTPENAMYTAFHGDGCEFTFEELTNPKLKNKKFREYTRPCLRFEGTDRSRVWIQYLMSPHSPWRDLHPFIAEKDVAWINNNGFIFHPIKDVPKKLLYNFFMAIRFCWEQAESFAAFLKLREKYEENLACYLSNHFQLKPGAKDWQGPWTIVYPWSYLEGLGVEQALPFIKTGPGVLKPDDVAVPNVSVLWGAQGPSDLSRNLEELSRANTLTLTVIEKSIKGLL